MKAARQGNGTEQVLSKSEGGRKRRKPTDGISTGSDPETRQPAPHTVPTTWPSQSQLSANCPASSCLHIPLTGLATSSAFLSFLKKFLSLTRRKPVLWTFDSLLYSKYIKELVMFLICLSSCYNKENNHFCLVRNPLLPLKVLLKDLGLISLGTFLL